MRAIQPLLLVLAAALLPACAATSHRYRFDPSPAEVQVFAREGGPQVARVLVSIVGAEREGGERDGHPLLVVRVRLEARGPGPVELDPATAQVLGPDLAEFGPPRHDLQGPVVVPAGEARDVTLRFPFPQDGNLRMPGLTGVNVNFQLDTPAGGRDISVSLDRRDYEYDDRYYHGRSHWHFGYFYGC